ncbi:MAG TPA: DUF4105 domain-containing protein [Myxococcota bacterium]|nr:DUF4105 domain-containing protein [Myxococcota bacterium]
MLLLLPIGWAAGALWFDGPASRPLAGALALAVGLGGALALLVLPFGRALLVSLLLFAGVIAWWLTIPPSQDRDWMADVARVPRTTRNGDLITIENIRNFHYRTETDYDERWETRTYDLSKMKGVDLFLVTWGAPGIAHTIASWEFEGEPPLAISIETRKQKGESYSAIRGFFRQYELYYVVADERDVIGVRASHRGERPSLYRIHMEPENAKKLLLRYLDEVDDLAAKPRWYNALTHNCTTEIRWNLQAIGLKNPLDWRIFANAHLPELMYARKAIDTSLPLDELVKISDVTEKAKAADGAPDFSARIREGLPGMNEAGVSPPVPAGG